MKDIKSFVTISVILIVAIGFIVLFFMKSEFRDNNDIETAVSSYNNSIVLTTFSNNLHNKRMDESWMDFPYRNMYLCDDWMFEYLKKSYQRIDFYGEFKQGDIDKYNYYLREYLQLLNNEVFFYDRETGGNFYLQEFEYMTVIPGKAFDLNNYDYCYFDMDGDGSPELCIIELEFIYIFKYIPDLDKHILWNSFSGSWNHIIGSGKVDWHNAGTGDRYVFYQLDEEGAEELSVCFFSQYGPENVYVVALPRYACEDECVEITDKITSQAYTYFDGDEIVYCFRVTEQQYDELTNDYFAARELAEENIKEVRFTYEELFGDITDME